MSTSARILNVFRLTHLYLGVFIAPSLLFFALSGALQTLSLHQAAKGSTIQPPNWIVILAQIHKNQTIASPERKQKPVPTSAKPQGKEAFSTTIPMKSAHHSLPLKIFFVVVSAGLLNTALTGLYMAYKYKRNLSYLTGVLLAGTAIPVTFALF